MTNAGQFTAPLESQIMRHSRINIRTALPMNIQHLAVVTAMATAIASGCSRSETPPSADSKGSNPASATATGKDKSGSSSEQAQRGKSKTAVTLQLNWVPEPEFGGFYAAAHKGLYEAGNLDVKIVAGGAGVRTWNMVATGKVPFAIASADEIVRAGVKDADVVALFAVYQTNPQAIMVHEDSGISSLEEIFTSGNVRRVAMEAGLPYGRFLKNTYGFDKVEIIQYSGNLTLFLQDKTMAQQCFIFSEPVSAQEQNVPVKAFSIGDSGFNPYLAVLITSRAYLQKHTELVETFVRASRAGWQAYLTDPQATNQYMKEQNAQMTLSAMKIAAELQTPYISNRDTEAQYLGYMSEGRWQTLAEQLLALGEIDRIPNVADLFHNIPPMSTNSDTTGQ